MYSYFKIKIEGSQDLLMCGVLYRQIRYINDLEDIIKLKY